jgi:hypothetical protein
LKIPQGVIRIRNRRRTDNTFAKRKRTKGQTTIYKSLHRNLKIEFVDYVDRIYWYPIQVKGTRSTGIPFRKRVPDLLVSHSGKGYQIYWYHILVKDTRDATGSVSYLDLHLVLTMKLYDKEEMISIFPL